MPASKAVGEACSDDHGGNCDVNESLQISHDSSNMQTVRSTTTNLKQRHVYHQQHRNCSSPSFLSSLTICIPRGSSRRISTVAHSSGKPLRQWISATMPLIQFCGLISFQHGQSH